MTGTAFTCVVPVWGGDGAAALAEALASIAASSVRPQAVIVAQDGPLPPGLEAVVAGVVRAMDARVVLNGGRRGLQHNLNNAIARVSTPYVARLDADDVNLPGRFAAQVDFAAHHPEVAAFGGAIEEFGPKGRTRLKPVPLTHAAILRYAAWRNPINHMTAFFRTDAFLAVGGYPDIPLKEDYGLWLAMLARGARLANLAETLVRARLGADFPGRRAGWRNLASERAIHRLKRDVPGIDPAASTAALVARSALLALPAGARLAYATVLRR